MTRVLIVNMGSSGMKWALLRPDGDRIAAGNESWASAESDLRERQIRRALAAVPAFELAGHRVVHGGTRFREAVSIDDRIREELGDLAHLDPEHMEASLAGIDAIRAAFPAIPQVAAFDTAFHATISDAAAGYGLPYPWVERWGLRRFGFHGLSVGYVVERIRDLLEKVPDRLIVCHLGSGCSITAVAGGRSVDTTMGFTPLEGLMMATRSGSVDPGLLLHLQEHCGVGLAELRDVLTRRSGLLGVSGVSGDLRVVIGAMEDGSSRARLAYDRFVLGIRRGIGAMAGVLGGVDAVVFTGGIGEGSDRIRRDVAGALAHAGLDLDPEANASGGLDRDISRPGTPVRALVIQSREDLAILREVLEIHSSDV